jgi:NDP-hexose-3-ketoreductase
MVAFTPRRAGSQSAPMKTLLLGYSDIARRRILPALRRVGITAIDIASRSAGAVLPEHLPARLFEDYEEALRRTDAAIVYVSTVNSLHGHWARKALEAGFHVVVDKPACLGLPETFALVELANRKGACLAEAITYSHHPQIEAARRQFESAGTAPTHIVAAFSFPPLAATNFRYRADLGGGALWDLGPYAATLGRAFFHDPPIDIGAQTTEMRGPVETSFSMLTRYSEGRTCVGSFGFTTGYVNRLDLLGPGMTIGIDRAFSPPADRSLEIVVRHHDETTGIRIPPSDSFALFLDEVLAAISAGKAGLLASRMLDDAQALDRLRASAAGRRAA